LARGSVRAARRSRLFYLVGLSAIVTMALVEIAYVLENGPGGRETDTDDMTN